MYIRFAPQTWCRFVLIIIFITTTTNASTISSVSQYDGGGWCGANGGCRLKIIGTGFGDEFNRPIVRLSPQPFDMNVVTTVSTSTSVQIPCDIINYWSSNTTIICTVGQGAYEAFQYHERYKYFNVEVIHNYRKAKCTSSYCRVLFSKVNNAKLSSVSIPTGSVKSISFNDMLQLNGNDLYNDNKADVQNIFFGHVNNKCNPASTQMGDSESNVPLLGNSYSQIKCRLDNDMLQPGKYNATYLSYIRHMRGSAILKNTIFFNAET